MSLMFLLHFGVLCDLLLLRNASLSPLVLYINKANYTDSFFFYFEIFQHNSKGGPFVHSEKHEKCDFTYFTLIFHVFFHWLPCVAKIVIVSWKSRHSQTSIEYLFLWNRKLSANVELSCEICNLVQNAEK